MNIDATFREKLKELGAKDFTVGKGDEDVRLKGGHFGPGFGSQGNWPQNRERRAPQFAGG